MWRTDVDGVPVLLAPSPGPMRAGLVFRVGRADETLARGGITHLIEHLALHRHGLTDYHYNGTTGAITTSFHMQGPEDAVVAFLHGVCSGLSDLPLDRLEVEKAILRTEASGRGQSTRGVMASWRHGARGHGLLGYGELGLAQLSAHDVSSWAARWFTRENAVLWITGDRIPPTLRLPLAGGYRMPVPEVSSALPVTPAYFQCHAGGVMADGIVPDTAAARLYSLVLERQLFRALRQDAGLSYTASTALSSFGDGTAILTALADALPEHHDAVLNAFVEVISRSRAGHLEHADVESALATFHEALSRPDAAAGRLPDQAARLLFGERLTTPAERLEEVRAVGEGELRAVAAQAWGTALLLVPPGRTADWAGFVAAPTASDRAVQGDVYRSREDKDSMLVLGQEGVSGVHGDRVATVRFADCAALLAYPDGARTLTGQDGITVEIEPTLFAVPPAYVAALDQLVPPDRIVWLPARTPERIPVPRTKAELRVMRRRPGADAVMKKRLILAWCISPVVLFVAMVAVLVIDPNPDRGSSIFATILCMGVPIGVVAGAIGSVIAWRRR